MSGRPFIDWAWIGDHLDDIFARTIQHLYLAAIALFVGFVLAFVLALAIRRYSKFDGPIVGVTGILYTIPSLALFAALVPVTGLTIMTAVIPLIIYTLLIYVRSMTAGLRASPPEILEAADAMGFTSGRRLREIELPLALPLIISGVRIATVSTIGLVVVSALIGDNFGGLGFFIRDGINTFFPTKVYVGAVMSVVLALIADAALVGVERRATPWARARAQRAVG
jgi:osmoprotectant transport system permease protein